MTKSLSETRKRGVYLAMAILVAFGVGTSLQPRAAVRAGVREAAPQQHFLAGGERAVPVLMEISETLKRIDTRLARIENTVTQLDGQQ